MGKIEVEKVERDIAVAVNIVVMQSKVIGGRPRILFILIANILFVHDDEVACTLLCTYRDPSMRYYKFFPVETGSSTNTVESDIILCSHEWKSLYSAIQKKWIHSIRISKLQSLYSIPFYNQVALKYDNGN